MQWLERSVPTWAVVAIGAALVLLIVVALVQHRRWQRRLDAVSHELGRTEQTTGELLERLERLERQPQPAEQPEPATASYLITRFGESEAEPDDTARSRRAVEPTSVSGPLFADLVLREGAVQAVSVAAGLRRALSPETRNRIRFQMKQEVKRARKERKTQQREFKRAWAEQQRNQVREDADGATGDAEDSAA